MEEVGWSVSERRARQDLTGKREAHNLCTPAIGALEEVQIRGAALDRFLELKSVLNLRDGLSVIFSGLIV